MRHVALIDAEYLQRVVQNDNILSVINLESSGSEGEASSDEGLKSGFF